MAGYGQYCGNGYIASVNKLLWTARDGTHLTIHPDTTACVTRY